VAAGEKPVVADAHEAIRQHVQQEATQELVQGKGQGTFAIALGGVAPAKGDLFGIDRYQAVVGNGNAVGVSAEIVQDLLGASEGRFAVDHPVVSEQGAQESSKGLRLRQAAQTAMEVEAVTG